MINIKSNASKVVKLDHLLEILGPAKASGQKVVQCHGVFDLLHIGHIRHFDEAKGMGDILVVTQSAISSSL